MSCEACDEREKKIDELLRAVKALKVDISGRSEITLLLQQKYEAEFDLRRKVGGQLAIAVLQVEEYRKALEEIYKHEGPGLDGSPENVSGRIARLALVGTAQKRVEPSQKKLCGTWVPEMGPCVAEVPCKAHPEKQNEPLHLNSTRCADCGASLTDGHGH